MKDIVAELDAKAHQSSTRRNGAGGLSRAQDHVCYRAAREIERLRKIENVTEAEKGWRSFWNAFCDHLRLGSDQRTYSWHELMNACESGMTAVKRDAT